MFSFRLSNFRVLKSAEVDILADGTLDLPDDVLRELNFSASFACCQAARSFRAFRAYGTFPFVVFFYE